MLGKHAPGEEHLSSGQDVPRIKILIFQRWDKFSTILNVI